MKNYKQFVKELPSKKVVFAFGRFQPPTTGHELLVKVVKEVAGSAADHVIYASKTQDKKDNPLPVDRKMYFLKRMFPGTNFKAADQNVQSFIEAAKELNNKYKNAIMVAGSDRVTEYQGILEKYNGIEFQFDTIEVVSAGERDPDSELASGMSGTKMREAAKAGDFNRFKKGVPHTLMDLDSRRLMNDIRSTYGSDPIKETVEFSRSTIRERYIAGSIFNIGDKVQDENGTYEIMDRGANYITVVNESGQLSKKWIDKVTAVEITEDIPNEYNESEISFKGYTTKNLHHSSDAVKAFQETIAKYNDHLIKDGVAILNALKSTDIYMNVNIEHIDKSQIHEWLLAHTKVKESLVRINEFENHIDYWNSHGSKIQTITGMEDPIKSFELEDTMIKEKLKLAAENKRKAEIVNEAADPVETKKIMLSYKDYLKKAGSSELPVEIGGPAANPAPVKTVEPGKKDTESDSDAMADKTQLQNKVGHTLNPDHGNETLRKQKVHYHLGESNNHYDEAEKHLSLANDADAKGEKATFHAHMANHHDAMSEWHESKGRSASADKHAEKADYHHEKSLTVKEDVYTSDTKTKDYMTKDKDGNWVWRKRKIHPKRITFAASKMGGDPSQQARQDEAYGVYRNGGSIGSYGDKTEYHPIHGQLISKHDSKEEAKSKAKSRNSNLSPGEKGYYRIKYHVKPLKEDTVDESNISEAADVPAHEHPYNRPHNEPAVSHTKLKVGEHARAPYNRIVFGGALSKMWHAKNKSGQVKAFVNSDAAKKHALSEEVELDESTYSTAEAAKSIADKLKTKHKDGNYQVKQTKSGHKVVHAYYGDTKVKNDIKKIAEEVDLDESAYPTEKTQPFGSWILKQKSMISKTPAEKSKKVTKGKTSIADKEAFDAKNAGGTPPFDPFFNR